MGQCLYADCDGQVEPGAGFCDECGRSQTAAQVAAARAGAQARAATVPVAAAIRPSVAVVVPLLPATPLRGFSIPLTLAFGLVFLLLFLGCVGALAIQVALSPLIPLPAVRSTPTIPPSSGVPDGAPVYARGVGVASGRRTVTVVPAPNALSNPTVPPWAVTISRTIANPSPPTLTGESAAGGAAAAGGLLW